MPMTEEQRASARTVGFEHCEIWRFDKDLIAAGSKSLGDETEFEAAEQRAYAEDLTGDAHGDVAAMETIDRAAVETAQQIREHRESGGFVVGGDE